MRTPSDTQQDAVSRHTNCYCNILIKIFPVFFRTPFQLPDITTTHSSATTRLSIAISERLPTATLKANVRLFEFQIWKGRLYCSLPLCWGWGGGGVLYILSFHNRNPCLYICFPCCPRVFILQSHWRNSTDGICTKCGANSFGVTSVKFGI
jgi:hypothetical protein